MTAAVPEHPISAVRAAVFAAIGGLMFGYDTGIVGSALLFVARPDQFALDEFGQQAFVAVLLAGAVLSVLVAGTLADRLGRKRMLIAIAVLFLVGAATNALTPLGMLWLLFASRFVLGLAVGASSLVVPLYIAEIAPARLRGRLVSLNQGGVAGGIFVAYLVGSAYSGIQGWREMIGLATVPAAVMLIGMLRQPESPRWLALKGRADEAKQLLERLRGGGADREYRDIEAGLREEQKPGLRQLFADPVVRRGILIGVTVAATNQLVGVNAVLYYAPTILKRAGFDDQGAIFASTAIAFTGFVLTVVALILIDRVGRRPLLLGGIAIVVVTLGVLGGLFLVDPLRDAQLWLVIGFIVYEAAFSASLGIAIWLVNSEILPNRVRGTAQQFGTNTHWVLDLLISMTTLTLLTAFTPSGLFWLFGVFGIVGFVLLHRILPETKDRSLEAIESELTETVTGSVAVQR